jgi:transposase
MEQDHSFRLSSPQRVLLEQLLRQRKADNLTARRANALLLLDDGLNCKQIAKVLYIDAETVRLWRKLYENKGINGLELKDYSKREGLLNRQQEGELIRHFTQNPARSTHAVRTFIEARFDAHYAQSGAIKLMHRLGFCYKKPKPLPLGASVGDQEAQIAGYNQLMNTLAVDESVVFADAVHPEYQSKPAFGWFRADAKVALPTTTGRKRLNIHAAFNLETSKLTWVESTKISAETTQILLKELERTYPDKHRIHVFLDNAKYHHAKILKPWLERPGCRIRLHFLPAYAPHLNPIERLWGIMHEHVTHNRYYETFDEFIAAILGFFRNTVPQKAHEFRSRITDNFRVISNHQYQTIR